MTSSGGRAARADADARLMGAAYEAVNIDRLGRVGSALLPFHRSRQDDPSKVDGHTRSLAYAVLDDAREHRSPEVAETTTASRTRVPRFCPKCGEPEPQATDDVMWCRRCGWAEERGPSPPTTTASATREHEMATETTPADRTEAQRNVEHAKAMTSELTTFINREWAASEMKASFLRSLTPELAAEMLAETLLQLNEAH